MSDKNESFIRWQGRSLEQLGKTINLILGLSLATMGFTIAKILDKGFQFVSCSSKIAILTGCFIILVTITILLWVTLNRLKSFKTTAQIARKREKNINDNIDDQRREVKLHDANTWFFFKLAIILFFFGELIIITGFIIEIALK